MTLLTVQCCITTEGMVRGNNTHLYLSCLGFHLTLYRNLFTYPSAWFCIHGPVLNCVKSYLSDSTRALYRVSCQLIIFIIISLNIHYTLTQQLKTQKLKPHNFQLINNIQCNNFSINMCTVVGNLYGPNK